MIKGKAIDTPEDAVLRIMRGEALFIDNRRLDPGWAQNWSLTTIKRLVGQGRLFATIDDLDREAEGWMTP